MRVDEILKECLNRHFTEYEIFTVPNGQTSARLYNIRTADNRRFTLKYQRDSLRNDYLNYSWLNGKVPVPKVLFYEQVRGFEWLCMTTLKGYSLEAYMGKMPSADLVRRYAQALKRLHAVTIDAHALVQHLSDRLLQAKYNLEHGLVDVAQMQPANKVHALDTLFEWLMANQPNDFDGVFTHGDYCLDNLFFDNEVLTGFIDLDKGGVADRYQDLAIAIRSIKEDVDESFVPLFLDEYGLKEINRDKLFFYTLLDEFF